MSVRIRLKRLGRKNRPFYRVCAMDIRKPRDGKVIEELGTYDPLVSEIDARCLLNADRVAYWLGVGAQPSDKVAVLIKKYGPAGTHLPQQQAARERLAAPKQAPPAPEPVVIFRPKKKGAAETEPAAEVASESPPTDEPAAVEAAETAAGGESENQA